MCGPYSCLSFDVEPTPSPGILYGHCVPNQSGLSEASHCPLYSKMYIYSVKNNFPQSKLLTLTLLVHTYYHTVKAVLLSQRRVSGSEKAQRESKSSKVLPFLQAHMSFILHLAEVPDISSQDTSLASDIYLSKYNLKR